MSSEAVDVDGITHKVIREAQREAWYWEGVAQATEAEVMTLTELGRAGVHGAHLRTLVFLGGRRRNANDHLRLMREPWLLGFREGMRSLGLTP